MQPLIFVIIFAFFWKEVYFIEQSIAGLSKVIIVLVVTRIMQIHLPLHLLKYKKQH